MRHSRRGPSPARRSSAIPYPVPSAHSVRGGIPADVHRAAHVQRDKELSLQQTRRAGTRRPFPNFPSVMNPEIAVDGESPGTATRRVAAIVSIAAAGSGHSSQSLRNGGSPSTVEQKAANRDRSFSPARKPGRYFADGIIKRSFPCQQVHDRRRSVAMTFRHRRESYSVPLRAGATRGRTSDARTTGYRQAARLTIGAVRRGTPRIRDGRRDGRRPRAADHRDRIRTAGSSRLSCVWASSQPASKRYLPEMATGS